MRGRFADDEVARILADPTHILVRMHDAVPQGGGWIARCPVHAERTASCRVSVRAGKARWRCFGCGAHGDVLDLLKALEGLGFGEALLRLGAVPLEREDRQLTDDERTARVYIPREPWETVTEPTLFYCDCDNGMFRVDPDPLPPRWTLRRHNLASTCRACIKRNAAEPVFVGPGIPIHAVSWRPDVAGPWSSWTVTDGVVSLLWS